MSPDGIAGELDGEELLIMKESDIMGVIEGAAAPAMKAENLAFPEAAW
jgi:hypothetical protein